MRKMIKIFVFISIVWIGPFLFAHMMYAESGTKTVNNDGLFKRLKGRIVLQVEDGGKAYYINPKSQTIEYLGRPSDAFKVMRDQGVGITNRDLEKISIGLETLAGKDSDNDGLPDEFEVVIGTKKDTVDTDGDGYSDRDELKDGYSPFKSGQKLPFDRAFAEKNKGKFFLQVENGGAAWYVNPANAKRYYLGKPNDAFRVIRILGIGISNKDFSSLVGGQQPVVVKKDVDYYNPQDIQLLIKSDTQLKEIIRELEYKEQEIVDGDFSEMHLYNFNRGEEDYLVRMYPEQPKRETSENTLTINLGFTKDEWHKLILLSFPDLKDKEFWSVLVKNINVIYEINNHKLLIAEDKLKEVKVARIDKQISKEGYTKSLCEKYKSIQEQKYYYCMAQSNQDSALCYKLPILGGDHTQFDCMKDVAVRKKDFKSCGDIYTRGEEQKVGDGFYFNEVEECYLDTIKEVKDKRLCYEDINSAYKERWDEFHLNLDGSKGNLLAHECILTIAKIAKDKTLCAELKESMRLYRECKQMFDSGYDLSAIQAKALQRPEVKQELEKGECKFTEEYEYGDPFVINILFEDKSMVDFFGKLAGTREKIEKTYPGLTTFDGVKKIFEVTGVPPWSAWNGASWTPNPEPKNFWIFYFYIGPPDHELSQCRAIHDDNAPVILFPRIVLYDIDRNSWIIR